MYYVTTLKEYCKTTLNLFLRKKVINDSKIFYLGDRYFLTNQKFVNIHIKIV